MKSKADKLEEGWFAKVWITEDGRKGAAFKQEEHGNIIIKTTAQDLAIIIQQEVEEALDAVEKTLDGINDAAEYLSKLKEGDE